MPVIQVDDANGALGDYAGNTGDPTPGFIGLASDFVFGGNGNGVLISSRARCMEGAPTADWADRVAGEKISDGLSRTLLVGERHISAKDLGIPPIDGAIFDGSHLPAIARVAGDEFPIAAGPLDETDSQYVFGSWRPNTCEMALCDGSVRRLAVATDTSVLAALANRADGN